MQLPFLIFTITFADSCERKEYMEMCDERNILKFEWLDNPEQVGEMKFTFDGKKVFNLFQDYPHSLTEEQKILFDKENPFWADFFKNRK